MQGRGSNARRSNGRYAYGGAVRDIGVKVKPYGSNPHVTEHCRQPAPAKAGGGACEIEGGAAKGRLDRPMKKRGD